MPGCGHTLVCGLHRCHHQTLSDSPTLVNPCQSFWSRLSTCMLGFSFRSLIHSFIHPFIHPSIHSFFFWNMYVGCMCAFWCVRQSCVSVFRQFAFSLIQALLLVWSSPSRLAWLASESAIFLSLPLPCWECKHVPPWQAFSHKFWGSSLGSHIHPASTSQVSSCLSSHQQLCSVHLENLHPLLLFLGSCCFQLWGSWFCSESPQV